MTQCKSSEYGLSELEHKIICDQVARRKELREQFLKMRTDPCLHSKESGYVFDPAMQKFLSMKCTQLEYFKPSFQTVRFALGVVVLPMLTYGYFIWKQRTARESDIRSGCLRYRERLFKFC